jgi:hypothetical protein
MTGVGFDFLPLHVVLSVEYPAEYGKIHGPKMSARFPDGRVPPSRGPRMA